MVKADWGLKRICPQCGTRYYDMKKNPPVCPSCGSAFDPETLLKNRRGRQVENRKSAPAEEEEINNLPVMDGDEADDALIEDADELADEDVDEVIEVETGEEDNGRS